jgi:hypothetical protein
VEPSNGFDFDFGFLIATDAAGVVIAAVVIIVMPTIEEFAFVGGRSPSRTKHSFCADLLVNM